MLTDSQKLARAALLPKMREAVLAAVWEVIEDADPGILADDNGDSYAFNHGSTGPTGLESMTKAATDKAVEALRGWL